MKKISVFFLTLVILLLLGAYPVNDASAAGRSPGAHRPFAMAKIESVILTDRASSSISGSIGWANLDVKTYEVKILYKTSVEDTFVLIPESSLFNNKSNPFSPSPFKTSVSTGCFHFQFGMFFDVLDINQNACYKIEVTLKDKYGQVLGTDTDTWVPGDESNY